LPDPGQGEGKGEALIKTFNATHVEKMVTSHEIGIFYFMQNKKNNLVEIPLFF
jgi:hypothetical protein